MPTNSQALSPSEIDAIVKEVVRRICELAGGSTGSDSTENGSTECLAIAQTDTQVCRISERLVTTETLRGKLEHITTLVVEDRALVTPAVRDLLTDKRIDLVRKSDFDSTKIAAKQRQTEYQFHIEADNHRACQSQAQTMANRLKIRAFPTPTSFTQRTNTQVPSYTNSTRQIRVVVTEKPHHWLWHLHQAKEKAARCQTATELKEALFDFNATTLVVDGRCGLSHELLEAMIQIGPSK